MKNIKLLWKYMSGFRAYYLGAILSIGLGTLFSLAGPLIMSVTIDSIIGDQPVSGPQGLRWLIETFGGVEYLRNQIWIPGLLLVLMTVFRGIFLYLKGKWSAVTAESVAESMRNRVYNHLQHLSYDYHVKTETGDLIQRCTSDVDTIRKFLGTQFVEIGSALFMLVIAGYIMLSLNVTMTLIALAVVPFIFMFAVIFFIKIRRAFQLSDEAEGKMSSSLQENLTGLRVVRAFAQQAHELEKFEVKNRTHRDLTYRLIKLLAWYWSISDFLCFAQIGLVLLIGIYWASTGSMTLGTLVVFNTYVGMLLWPVRQMGRVLTDMGKASVALDRIEEIMMVPTEQMEENGEKPSIKGDISFSKVSFEYEKGKAVLRDITFDVKAGETIAILGATGSGKTTMVHLLARLYDYQEGSIKIDGRELKTIDKGWIRKNVGLILQETFLFAKTLKDNIRLAKVEAQDQEVFEVSKVAALHNVVKKFDKGYETMVGERGVSLSGGQKQRVAIARTLINETPIIIFDDSLSAVDTETDAFIRRALGERKKKATTFIISHRISTLSEADRILVLNHGQIVQMGSHQELMKQPGMYRRIWEIQSSLEEEFLEDIEHNCQTGR